MKILITGRKGKLLKAVAAGLGHRAGISTVIVPVGSRLLDAAKDPSLQLAIFVVSGGDEVEPIRWTLQQNPSVPVLAVLPRGDPKLRAYLKAEGVSQVLEIARLDAPRLRRDLVARLKRLPFKLPPAGSLVAEDLHEIRSALTAILGSAEMALKGASASVTRKHLQQIFRGVAEIEVILRRLERPLKPAS